MSESETNFQAALDRLYDVLLGDDGQAFKEAERFLLRHRPELAEKLQQEPPHEIGRRNEPGYYSPENLDKLVNAKPTAKFSFDSEVSGD